MDRCKWKGLWIWSEYMYFDAFYQTDIYWLFSDFMTRSEREETIRSCSVIPPTAPTFLAFSDQLQVIPATKWSPKGWVCNTLNHWAAAFDLKVNANTLKSIWVGLCWWTQLVCNSSQLLQLIQMQLIQMQSVFIMGIQLYVRINYSSIVRGDEMAATRWNSDDRKAEV